MKSLLRLSCVMLALALLSAPSLVVAAKKTKLATLFISQPLVALMLLAAALKWIGRRLGLIKTA